NTIFIQSDISAHSELAWILDCFLPLGWMNKMTQFKEKSEMQKENATVGLFNYPALMAADILLYDTEVVPVGSDQKQHVELARDVAKRFNSIYEKNIFIVPEAKIRKETARIMDLQNPLKKMSKSEGKSIGILDSLDDIQSKIMTAHTDSFNEVAFDDERPGIHNLLTIYEAFSGESRGDIETKFEGKGYADFKKDLAELVIEKLIPIQDKYKEISESGEIDEVLKKGAEKARPLAEKKIQEVKKVIGLG
ncbi:MAG: tryptophan--tRNA ligase, partial [Patescibacteria group bacterium]